MRKLRRRGKEYSKKWIQLNDQNVEKRKLRVAKLGYKEEHLPNLDNNDQLTTYNEDL